jgi:hypothetical protein
MIGLDGATPEPVERGVEENKLPDLFKKRYRLWTVRMDALILQY